MSFFEKFLKFLHWEKSKKPEIDLTSEIYAQLKPFRFPIILLILLMLIGTLGYVFIDKVSVFLAFYQTGITFTTVGFGEFWDMSKQARTFSVFLIIFGFIVFSFAVGVMIDIINKGTLFKLIKERSMLYKIARLKRHYVICYFNDFTIKLADELRRQHIPFVIVDPREDLEEIAKQYKFPFFIQEDPHTDIAIKKSFMSSAKGVIILSKNIADNIAVISSVRLFEKELGRKPYIIISLAENKSDIEKLKKLGADNVLSSTKLIARKMTGLITNPKMENLMEDIFYEKSLNLSMQEIKVPKNSWLILKKLKETHLRDIANVDVVAIKRADGKYISMPKGNELIQSEDRLLVIGKESGLKKTRQIIRKSKKPEELQYV